MVKPSEVFNRLYTVSGGNLVNNWDVNGFFPFRGNFHFCHEFKLILESKRFKFKTRGLRDICIRDLFFKFLENKEEKD